MEDTIQYTLRLYSRWPSFSSLYGEERQHGNRDLKVKTSNRLTMTNCLSFLNYYIVVVELLPLPRSGLDGGRVVAQRVVDEVLAPAGGFESGERQEALTEIHLLAVLGVLLAGVVAIEELSIEELDGDDGEDEVEKEVHDKDVEHVLERVDDAVEDGLQLRHALDRLQGPEHAKHAKRLDRAQLLPAGGVVAAEKRKLH